jgi:hypothetical protein
VGSSDLEWVVLKECLFRLGCSKKKKIAKITGFIILTNNTTTIAASTSLSRQTKTTLINMTRKTKSSTWGMSLSKGIPIHEMRDIVGRSSAQIALDKIKAQRRGRKFEFVQIDNRTWKEVEVC